MMSFTERESHDAAMGRFYDASADFWRLRILCTAKFQFPEASRSKTIHENFLNVPWISPEICVVGTSQRRRRILWRILFHPTWTQ